MNEIVWAGPVAATLAIVAGLVICFGGYRILKMSLGIIGFVAGAYGGWELGLSLAHGNTGIALACALVGGLVGAGLCFWLYFAGIFLMGAMAGAVLAAALFSGTGQQTQPIVFLAFPVVFGIIALLAQKFMIVLSTAFSGSYLVAAGVWSFATSHEGPSHIWLHPAQTGSFGTLGYAALGLWILLGMAGIVHQFRSSRRKAEVARVQT